MEYDALSFPILSVVAQYAKEENGVQLLRKLLELEQAEQASPSTSHGDNGEDVVSAPDQTGKSINDVD